MAGIRHELHHFTSEQAREHLTEALLIVEQLDPPDDLRQVCFDKAVQMLSAKNINIEQVSPVGVRLAVPPNHG